MGHGQCDTANPTWCPDAIGALVGADTGSMLATEVGTPYPKLRELAVFCRRPDTSFERIADTVSESK
jgi:hypothetical protein